MPPVTFTDDAFQDFMNWVSEDRKVVKKINDLIKDIQRNGPSEGLGKPEALKYIDGWSRRITQEHRLVYRVDEDGNVEIISCAGHYKN